MVKCNYLCNTYDNKKNEKLKRSSYLSWPKALPMVSYSFATCHRVMAKYATTINTQHSCAYKLTINTEKRLEPRIFIDLEMDIR